MKNTPDERRGYKDEGRLSESPTPYANTTSGQVNFWAGWAGTEFMAPKNARRPRHAHKHFRLCFFKNKRKVDGSIVRLIPESEFDEALGMSIEAARFAGLIERSAQIAGETFIRPAPEVRP